MNYKNIKDIIQKTNDLENNIYNLTLKTNKLSNLTTIFNKTYLNFSITSTRKAFISKINTSQGKTISFESSIKFKLSAKQTISLAIVLDDEIICKETHFFEVGEHEYILSKSHTPLISKISNLYIEISSLDGKFISLISSIVKINGLETEESSYQYQTLELSDKFLVSHCHNNELFYCFTPKEQSVLNSQNFIYFAPAKAYSFTNINDILTLSRVDEDGNLFLSQFPSRAETLLASNVSTVTSIALADKIIISYVKDKLCYVFEMHSDYISEHKCINFLKQPISSSKLFFNKKNNKVYLILTTCNLENYIFESASETSSCVENLAVEYNFSISTYGGNS